MVQETLRLSTPLEPSLPRLRDGIWHFFDPRITLCEVSNQLGVVHRVPSGWIPTRKVARISVRNCTHISTTNGTTSPPVRAKYK